jgi:hypothetical protein
MSVSRGLSLHVGLNSINPDHYAGWNGCLDACESDASVMEQVAKTCGFEPHKLMLTSEATAGAILDAINDASRELEPGDIFFLSYAGHGGQVPDLNDEELDGEDETWLAYDRQIVDDELYLHWRGFRPGVRIIVVSDSCHGGAVTSARALGADAPDPVLTQSGTPVEPARYRGMPRDVMLATYDANRGLYDRIQETVPTADESEVRATLLAFLGCLDYQLAAEGPSNGLFTENVITTWNGGAWKGSHAAFHKAIRSRMPPSQTPNYKLVGARNRDFERQAPFTIA